MTRFKKRKELAAEIDESHIENLEVRNKTAKIDKLRSELQEHLKENHLGIRLYVQLIQNWK